MYIYMLLLLLPTYFFSFLTKGWEGGLPTYLYLDITTITTTSTIKFTIKVNLKVGKQNTKKQSVHSIHSIHSIQSIQSISRAIP